ncbi:MAG: 3-deoxy-manno-octulosonate cytidylyltransferase [Planctomycetota bacterium]|nr:MAG: 3-deoxy-manno-octulosonate cytidylyltransferase [Planctomycetota bacterium]
MKALAVVPARLASTRLPRKLLLAESGKPLLQHVYERVRSARRVARVVIAVDGEELLAAARSFGAEAVLTREDHPSGTDRVAEAARLVGGDEPLVLNVQGDEPEIDPAHLDRLVEAMASGEEPMGTLAERLTDPDDLARPQVVKLVLDAGGRALLFSRAPIPHGAAPGGGDPAGPYRHLGVYAYRPDFLQRFCGLAPAPLERCERLEQLRALHYGHAVRVVVVSGGGARGIDTREDYDAFLARLRAAEGPRAP